ncbi:receptor expression-enhancing protein 2 [Podospora conica]|nr:receptor expression-enhancing protein 2 [Schizothecium conicum]
MFDIFAKILSSIASFLFPLFASYKALKTSDPSQLTPWLMYWVVLACALLVESWTEWLLVWIPFYAYIRLLFLLYLVLPQTQGARIIYQTYVHPWLEDNESSIEDFIASAHERLRAAGMAYIKQAIELLKTNVLGMAPSPQAAAASAPTQHTPQSYTQSLLARFNLPAAGWPANNNSAGSDFYSFLSSAVSAAAGAASAAPRDGSANMSASSTSTLIPDSIVGSAARMSFLQAQRERLNSVMFALDREATQLQSQEADRAQLRATGWNPDGSHQGEGPPPSRSLSEQSVMSGLSKSRSVGDFEKLEAESGEEDGNASPGVRLRATPSAASGAGGSWMPWGWGAGTPAGESARSSGVDRTD